MFDLRKIFDLRKFFAVPKNFLKSKIHCTLFLRSFTIDIPRFKKLITALEGDRFVPEH